MNLLIADDESPCLDLFREIFAGDSDVDVTFAENGADAWWHLTEPQQIFDAAIVDLNMPKFGGLALIARIRGSVAHRHLPIILCTGMSDRDTVAKAARLAINHYVVKPFHPNALREKVRSFAPTRPRGTDHTLLKA